MATLSVLTFDPEGRLIQFDTWLDDLQLFLLSVSSDGVSLFDLTSGASLAPPDTADSATRSEWLTRDAAARLAVRNHLPLAERAHFGQHKTAKALYGAVVARYSSPATAALSRLILPYLFPELSAFASVDDLITHLLTSDTRYRAVLPTMFLDANPPPMYITLYFIVTRLPDSLSAVRDLFLAMDPTDLTVDLLEKHLLAAEASIVAVGAARGTPRTPFFEGLGGTAAARAREARVVGVAAVEAVVGAVEAVEVAVVAEGVVVGVEALVAAVVAAVGVVAAAVVAAVGVVAAAVVAVGEEPVRGEVLAVVRGSSSSVRVRPLRPRSFVSGLLSVGRLGVVFAASTSFAQFLHIPPLFSRVRRFRPAHSQVFTSPRSLRTWSLPALPPSPAPPCLPCVEGWQRAAPHSSSFPSTTAPLQTLHMDVWGPARVRG
ncbi:unnamed protein product [Closterium sp. Naga37s-1]|nr:unnamed protein product [Closterium sp. Naga37s-1]